MNGLILKNEEQLHQYQIVITPHTALKEQITDIKKQFADTYKTDAGRWLPPAITLAHYRQSEITEPAIMSRLQQLCQQTAPFLVPLKNFGSFPTHTIFINVHGKIAVQQFNKNIRTLTQRLMTIDKFNKPHFIMEPYIVIGRKLEPWQYEQASNYYLHTPFTASFIAKNITVLKKAYNSGQYTVFKKIELHNITGIKPVQQVLF